MSSRKRQRAGRWSSRNRTLPDGKSNKGRVQAFDGPIYIADAALYLMKKKPELGIKDPYELTEEQYKAALDLLRAQRNIVGRYWHDAFIQIDDFKTRASSPRPSWPFQVNLLKADKQPIASTIPEEGATGWADTTRCMSTPRIPTAPTCGSSIRSTRSFRAISRRGSVQFRQ